MIKLSLEEIKAKIQIYPENWLNITNTNCYAYALGLDVFQDSICRGAFIPGVISGVNSADAFLGDFEYSAFVEGLREDFRLLDIFYREIKPEEKIESNEWKIAVYTELNPKGFLFDFHFLRANSDDIWKHKIGFYGQPTTMDYSDNLITDPLSCDLAFYEYQKCYALRLKQS